MATQTYTDGVTLTAAAEFNNFDSAAYSVLSGVAGTNTITGTGPANYSYSAARPTIWFIPAVTNTAAATINVTPSGSSSLGAKSIFTGGAALSGGELIAGVPVGIIYDGTQFNIVGPRIGTRLINSLSGSVTLNNTGTYFTGPQVAQGTVGTWLVMGTVTVVDTIGGAVFSARIGDGTTVLSSTRLQTGGANVPAAVSLSGYITSPVANLRISIKDETSTSGQITFNNSGNTTDSTIIAIRIA